MVSIYNILINSRRNFFFFLRFSFYFFSLLLNEKNLGRALSFCCRFWLMLNTNWGLWKIISMLNSLKLDERERTRERREDGEAREFERLEGKFHRKVVKLRSFLSLFYALESYYALLTLSISILSRMHFISPHFADELYSHFVFTADITLQVEKYILSACNLVRCDDSSLTFFCGIWKKL